MKVLCNRPLRRVRKFDEGDQTQICVQCIRRSVLFGTVEPFAKGKSIHHTVPPYWQILMSMGPTQLYSMFLSTTDGKFSGKPICKTTFCLRCEAFADNCTCLTIWAITRMMTYSGKCHSVSSQLPLALPREWWDWWDWWAVTQVTVKARLRKSTSVQMADCVYSTCQ